MLHYTTLGQTFVRWNDRQIFSLYKYIQAGPKSASWRSDMLLHLCVTWRHARTKNLSMQSWTFWKIEKILAGAPELRSGERGSQNRLNFLKCSTLHWKIFWFNYTKTADDAKLQMMRFWPPCISERVDLWIIGLQTVFASTARILCPWETPLSRFLL